MKTFVLAVASSLVVACSVSADPVDSVDQELTCRTPPASEPGNPWWKTQYDGSKCENTNCGLASLAMLRYAVTCGQSDHTGGYMRARLNDIETGPDNCDGTNPHQWATLLEDITNLEVVEHRADGFTVDDLADKMSHGWKAVIPGSGAQGQAAPCGYTHDHALFIGNWDGERFDVYDPDSHNDRGSREGSNCGSTRTGHAVTRWTKAELRDWASGFPRSSARDLWLVIARAQR